MPIGSTWEIYLPADLAYGSSRGPGNALPPYSVLIFKIELIKAID
jgi:FKBP-type peptidyl-prolyl cis-trans isomerase FklB